MKTKGIFLTVIIMFNFSSSELAFCQSGKTSSKSKQSIQPAQTVKVIGWAQTNIPQDINISCFAIKENNIFVGVNAEKGSGLYLSSDNGNNWTNLSHCPLSDINCMTVCEDKIFAGGDDGLYVSSDNGESWNPSQYEVVNAIASYGSNIIASISIYQTIYFSKDAGLHWKNKRDLNGHTTALAILDTNIFAARNYTRIGTTYLGANPSNIKESGTKLEIETNSIIIDGQNVYLGTSNGVLVATKNGTEWTTTNIGMQNSEVKTLLVSGTNIFAGTSKGVFLTTDSGNTWKKVSNDFGVTALATNGPNILAGTDGNGVWYCPLSALFKK